MHRGARHVLSFSQQSKPRLARIMRYDDTICLVLSLRLRASERQKGFQSEQANSRGTGYRAETSLDIFVGRLTLALLPATVVRLGNLWRSLVDHA